MALFSRSLKPEGDAGSPAANGDSAESAPRHTIGDLLRDTRKSYGGEIDRIAATLRIRASYLTAIEENQYDKLPGPVYAQGFVRAYAVHLGLDGDEAIRRFKQEVAGFEVSRDLSFPVPLAERSIPGGTMVLAALILALCGYGLWYYVSTSDRSHPERVSAVPSDLVAATKKPDVTPPTPPTAATTAPATAAPAATQPSTPVATATTTTTPPPPVLSPPATTIATAPAAAPAASAPQPPAAQAPVLTPPPVPAPAAVQPAPTQATPATAASTPPATVAPPPSQTQTASAPAATPAPPSTDATAAPPGARVYGAPPGAPARIIIRAVKDSWVQVSSGSEVLTQRILHPGDSVRVPDERGLSLRTGNGAGIQFEIDGKLFKPLSGTVRTVALDADRLAANNGAPPRSVESTNGNSPRTDE